MSEKKYSVKEIAGRENVSIQTVYNWCINGYLPYSRRPSKKNKGSVVISETDYQDFKQLFKKGC